MPGVGAVAAYFLLHEQDLVEVQRRMRQHRLAAQRRQNLIEAAKREAERLALEAKAEREAQIERLLEPEAPIILPRDESSEGSIVPRILQENFESDPQTQNDGIFENLDRQLSTGDL